MNPLNSILKTIKKLLNVSEDCDAFDMDIIVGINSALATLRQLGVGPSEGFVVTGEDEVWSSIVGDSVLLEQVKQYVYLKVRTTFDPPSSSSVANAIAEQLKELEFRLNVQVDPFDGWDG